MIRLILDGIASEWCSFTHGGGKIMRDPSGRVNWQCCKCGRWAEPVSEGDEADLLRHHMERHDECPKCGTDEWDRITNRVAPGEVFNRCARCGNEWEAS